MSETMVMESGVIGEYKDKGTAVEAGGCGRVGEEYCKKGGLRTGRSGQKRNSLHK